MAMMLLGADRTIAYWTPALLGATGPSGTEIQVYELVTLAAARSRSPGRCPTGRHPAIVWISTVRSPGLPDRASSRSTWSRSPLIPAVKDCAARTDPQTMLDPANPPSCDWSSAPVASAGAGVASAAAAVKMSRNLLMDCALER